MSEQELYREKAEWADEVLQNELLPPRIGRLAAPGPSGEIFVECNGIPKTARLLSGVSRTELIKQENLGRGVLLMFEGGDSDRPIIVGLMEDPLESLVAAPVSPEAFQKSKEARVDGRRVTIEAQEEIVLKCGAGSITLRKDGKIIIKGTHLLSRSSGPNRIKGGSVQIN